MLNPGADFSPTEQQWKALVNRIEEIVTPRENMFPYFFEIERIAEEICS